jgi:alpha-beta hydrolase superfamily lysophospholipase
LRTFESGWTDRRGLEFFSRGWEPDGKPRAAIALVHGLGEHTGRFAHVGNAFSRAGYALVGFDLRGHGRSGGPRGHTPSFEAYMQDIDLFLAEVRARYPGIPAFMYGHSLGATLVLNYVLRRKPALAGVIATSPALHTELEDQPLKVLLARVLGGLVPTAGLASGLKTSMLSHDPQVERDYLADPLVHGRVSLGLGRIMLEINRWTLRHAAEFPLPLLLMHGALDTIAFPSSSQELASAIGAKATLVVWQDMYHETHNELRKDEVIKTLITWMDDHLVNKPV